MPQHLYLNILAINVYASTFTSAFITDHLGLNIIDMTFWTVCCGTFGYCFKAHFRALWIMVRREISLITSCIIHVLEIYQEFHTLTVYVSKYFFFNLPWNHFLVYNVLCLRGAYFRLCFQFSKPSLLVTLGHATKVSMGENRLFFR
jgi:hypothetical protein